MKKIAFFTFGHWGSTLPLAKKLSERGYNIDFYIECFEKRLGSIEATDVSSFKLSKLYAEIPADKLNSLKEYCSKVKFKYLRLLPPLVSHRLLGFITFLINHLLIYYYSFFINQRNYDGIILVGRNSATHFIAYHKFLKCNNIVTCMHEVCNHMNPDYNHPSPILKYLFKNKKPIIVHSNNTYRNILKFHNSKNSMIHHINFGLFESWRYCKSDAALESLVGSDYILFIGGIDEYKGMDTLYATISYLKKYNNDYRFVVAGKGSSHELKLMQNYENVTIINRFLNNSEFATLIRNCRAVICPYKSMSQSGIPQSALVFGKPIIASDLLGFHELMANHNIGILCQPHNEIEFANAILRMYDNDDYKCYCENIKNFIEKPSSFNWDCIVDSYKNLFENDNSN